MWKDKLIEIAKTFDHPAWGFSHFSRVYNLALELSKTIGQNIDQDALFAAAYLHDIGALPPYKKDGVDHTKISIEQCESILKEIGFPLEKVSIVKDIIKSHMYYTPPSNQIEAILFHDADTLDFMGIIGISRILSIVGIDNWTPNLKSAIKLITKFQKKLILNLHTEQAQEIGKKRQIEMKNFLEALKKQTNNLEYI
ncbi:MAG: HD domain-containing protein [Candidatus Hermodarchaeota archaeon]